MPWKKMAASSDSLRVSVAAIVSARPTPRLRVFRIKAQNFREEGKSSNMVDASLSVLRKRIDEVKTKEKLERCCKSELGWNYSSEYYSNSNYKLRRRKQKEASEQLLEMVLLVFGNISFTVMSGTALLCFASLLIHLPS